jgi:hypothetical protein
MPDAAALHARLIDTIVAAEARRAGHVFLLLDQSAFPNLPKRKAALSRYPHDSLLASETAIDGASPLLIELPSLAEDEITRELLRWLCEQGLWANGLMLLCSPLPFSELKARLKIRTEARLPDNFAVLLRFFDGRIFPQLMSVLSAQQRKQFVGCAGEWHFVARDGTFQTLADVQFEEADLFEPPLELSQAQQNALLEASQVDAVIDQLLRHAQVGYAQTPYEQYRRIAPLVGAAKTYGIEDVPHLAAFSLIGLEDGADFHLKEPWSIVLAKVKAGSMNFAEALDSVENTE